MKAILTAVSMAVLFNGLALADTIFTPAGNTFVSMPANATFAANTNVGNTPYWNNTSLDGASFNVGFFLTNTGAFSSGTTSPAPLAYLANTATSTNAAPTAFSFLQSLTSINVTILSQNAGSNSGAFGTTFGLYDVANIANKIVLFGSGTIPASVGGPGVNASTSSISGSGYGFYATSCQNSSTGSNCYTFYSNTAINPSVTNLGSSLVLENNSTLPHQHFAVFSEVGNATSFYIGFEDSLGPSGFAGTNGFEKIGDFDDIIFRVTTGPAEVPEPGTAAIVGLGLVALAAAARRRRVTILRTVGHPARP